MYIHAIPVSNDQITKQKEKARKPLYFKGFRVLFCLELIARFELATSSLPSRLEVNKIRASDGVYTIFTPLFAFVFAL